MNILTIKLIMEIKSTLIIQIMISFRQCAAMCERQCTAIYSNVRQNVSARGSKLILEAFENICHVFYKLPKGPLVKVLMKPQRSFNLKRRFR